MNDNDKMRAEFEAWAKAKDLPIATYHFGETWSYVDLRTAWAHEGWRDGRKAEQREAEEWSKVVNKRWIETANKREGER